MKCPKCQSTQLRKNGRSGGKQRYLCKACGKQFFGALPDAPPSSTQSKAVAGDSKSVEGLADKSDRTNLEASSTSNPLAQHLDVPIDNNGHAEPTFSEVTSSMLSPPEALEPPPESVATPARSLPGIAILLLDAENVKLDTNAEKFLAELCHYPLQVKIAFANWRNPTIGKQDSELYDRGYQLIHAPGGKNSADAQMIALGASIYRHYPDAKEVFVCSSDWLLTNLCNELQSQGLTVYRVRRHNSTLSIENRNTLESRHYSLAMGTEIPSFEEFAQKIEELLHLEQESIHERIARVTAISMLLQERRRLPLYEERASDSTISSQNQESIPLGTAEESASPPAQVAVNLEASATVSIPLSARHINSQAELEQILIEIINSMLVKSPLDKVFISKLSAEVHKVCGEPANSIIKKLNLGSNFSKFLQSCPKFVVKKLGKNYKVAIAPS